MSKRYANILNDLRRAIAKAEKAGMTRYAIAKAAGMPRSQLTRVAAGQTIPTVVTAERIALAIGLKLSLV